MTRRWSVMRIPVAAQRASIPVALSAVVGFSAVMVFALDNVSVLPLRARYDKSGAFVKPPRRLIIFLDLEEHGTHAAAREMAEMRQQQIAGQAASAMAKGHGDRKYLGLVRRDARHREADHLPTDHQAVNQRVALSQHGLEFALAPAAMKRCTMQLRQTRRITQGCGFDRRRAAAPQVGQPRHHDADGCEAFCSGSL